MKFFHHFTFFIYCKFNTITIYKCKNNILFCTKLIISKHENLNNLNTYTSIKLVLKFVQKTEKAMDIQYLSKLLLKISLILMLSILM